MLISIIIPVYNIPKNYLKQCIDSIKKQSYTDWEIILIDDGSEQDCAVYLDTFSDSKVHVYHQSNKGVSAARNIGINKANGDWIVFIDPDDWMNEDELAELIDGVDRLSANMVYVNSYIFKNRKLRDGKQRYKDEIILNNQDINDLIYETIAPGSQKNSYGQFLRTPWAKIYNKKIIENNKIKFAEGIHPNEDTLFNIQYLKYCNCVVLKNSMSHCYRIYEESVTNSFSEKWVVNSEKTLDMCKLYEICPKNTDEKKYYNYFVLLLICDMCRLQFMHPANNQSTKEIRLNIYRVINSRKEYRDAIGDVFNPYYKYRRLVAICLKFKFIYLLKLMYRSRK